MRALSRALGAWSVACLLAAPGAATTYQRVADSDLADQASVVVEAVAGAPANVSDERLPATDYPFTVERAIRGAAAGDTLTVRVPGGSRADGLSLQIWGAPRFQPGERALLFLAPNSDGSFHVLHLMLGAFHVRKAADGRTLAVRDLSEAKEVSGAGVDPEGDPARDLSRFRGWLADRKAGVRRAPDYLLPGEPALPDLFPDKFTLLQAGGARMRWFGFEEGGSVAWAANSAGQPGVPGGGFAEFQRALAAWNAEPTTPIHYAYVGQTDATGGFGSFDRVNAILFDQPIADPFDCDKGGVLAIGGPWYDTRQRATWGGESFIPVTGADIVTNAGIGCFLARSANPSKAAEEIFGHELGHTLGLSHSCGDAGSGACAPNGAAGDALMRAYLHDDGRGARLADDDRRALQALYRPGAGSGVAAPAPPANLAVQGAGLTASLLWENRSGGEQGFRVYRATGTGKRVRIAELPAGTAIYVDSGLKPGSRYEYQVAAFNARGESSGPRAAISTPALQPLQALSLAPRPAGARGVRTGEPVAFAVSFSGPARQARWEFPGGLELSDAPCAPGSFCASHIFTAPGNAAVKVRLLGDLGQVAERTIRIQVEGPALDVVAGGAAGLDSASFLPNILSAPVGAAGPRSDLWLANDGDSATLARVTFRPRAAAAPVSMDMTLLPGVTLFVPDVLQTLFGAAGQGSLDLSYLPSVTGGGGGGGEARVRAFSRARSGDLAAGSLGPLAAEAPAAGWSAGEQVVAGLTGGDGSIATLLVDNLEETGGQVAVALFDSTGEPVGSPVALDLGPRASRSLRLDRLFPDLASHTGPFSARIAGNGIRFAAAATLLGGELQAPLFLPAQTGISGGELLIPRVARGPGAFNTFQFSRLLAANPSTQARELRCEFWPRGQEAPSRVATLTIPPRGSVFVEDVLRDIFGLNEALGALRISWSGGEEAPRVLSLAVSTARGGSGSRFAALVDSQAPEEAATVRSVDFGAAPSTVTRASWGAVNLGEAPANLRLSLRVPFRRGGALGRADAAPTAELRAGPGRNLPADRRRPLDRHHGSAGGWTGADLPLPDRRRRRYLLCPQGARNRLDSAPFVPSLDGRVPKLWKILLSPWKYFRQKLPLCSGKIFQPVEGKSLGGTAQKAVQSESNRYEPMAFQGRHSFFPQGFPQALWRSGRGPKSAHGVSSRCPASERRQGAAR